MIHKLSITYCLHRFDNLLLGVIDAVETDMSEHLSFAERADIATNNLVEDMGYLPDMLIAKDDDGYWQRLEIVDKRYFIGFVEIDMDTPPVDRDDAVQRALREMIIASQQYSKHPWPPVEMKEKRKKD